MPHDCISDPVGGKQPPMMLFLLLYMTSLAALPSSHPCQFAAQGIQQQQASVAH